MKSAVSCSRWVGIDAYGLGTCGLLPRLVPLGNFCVDTSIGSGESVAARFVSNMLIAGSEA